MKKPTKITGAILVLCICVLLGSCKKKEESVLPSSGIPVLTTKPITNIKASSASSGGNITSDEGSSISSRGVCWSTSQNPSISDSKTTDGSGIGTFTSNITGLKASTSYYVRAYATNTKGTGYGELLSLNTLAPAPGAVTITFNWDIHRKCEANDWFPCWDVVAGLGYSQSDIDKEAYFNHKELSSPGTYSTTNLPPGTYFYKAKKTIRFGCYITGDKFCGVPNPVIKTGSFQVNSNQTTSLTVNM